jgi:hypothetical protein
MMVVPMTFKHLFGVVAFAWLCLWFVSGLAISGLMGYSLPVLLFYFGMGLFPPVLLYFLLFRVLPMAIKRYKRSSN